MPSFGTYLLGKPVSRTTFLDRQQSDGQCRPGVPMYARTAGRLETYSAFLIGGSLTVQLWKAKEGSTSSGGTIRGAGSSCRWIFSPSSRAISTIDEEADHDIKFFNLIRARIPNVQPWLYAEWVEMNRAGPSDKGKVPSSQMKKTLPALTWEESMAAMLLYVRGTAARDRRNLSWPASSPRSCPSRWPWAGCTT